MDDDLLDVLENLRDGVIAAQMIAKASQAIVRELIIDVARLHPDPERYLKDLADRSAAFLDPQGSSEKVASAEARGLAEAMFQRAAKELNHPPRYPLRDGRQRP